jgi:preprotein translocase subunit SecD
MALLQCRAVGAAPFQDRLGGDAPGINLLTSILPPDPTKSPRVFFELRLAENEPVRGLTIEADVRGSSRKAYVHYRALLINSDLLTASVVEDQGRFGIALTLDPKAAGEVREAMVRHLPRPVAVILDGDVVAVWTLKSPLSDAVVIPATFTREEADRISSGIVW